jgi:hypothetical protein
MADLLDLGFSIATERRDEEFSYHFPMLYICFDGQFDTRHENLVPILTLMKTKGDISMDHFEQVFQ